MPDKRVKYKYCQSINRGDNLKYYKILKITIWGIFPPFKSLMWRILMLFFSSGWLLSLYLAPLLAYNLIYLWNAFWNPFYTCLSEPVWANPRLENVSAYAKLVLLPYNHFGNQIYNVNLPCPSCHSASKLHFIYRFLLKISYDRDYHWFHGVLNLYVPCIRSCITRSHRRELELGRFCSLGWFFWLWSWTWESSIVMDCLLCCNYLGSLMWL